MSHVTYAMDAARYLLRWASLGDRLVRASINFAPEARLDWPKFDPETAMLDNETKLNIAVVRFAGFVSNLPVSPNEDDVLEYHSIVELFEEGCGLDLSQFRIARDRVKPVVDVTGMASCYGWQPRYPKRNSVDFGYFRDQVRGLIAYLVTVLDSRPC